MPDLTAYDLFELDGVTVDDLATVRKFLSPVVDDLDTVRTSSSVRRRTVFVGTCGESAFLDDPDGNRRLFKLTP